MRFDGERDLAPARDQNDFRWAAGCIGKHVRAAGDAARRRVFVPVERRQRLPRQHQQGRPVLYCTMWRYVSTTSLASPGRITVIPGMARNEASCSIGWCVGPSSPSPIASWVNTIKVGSSMIAERRMAG